ncbi:PAS-domain containing protein [Phaeobacter sp. J2-8]|uniref:PAS-domain containing protein n=1 Tax=Phaeobacter sp. J2-8 TaxID=2931394 RepID=UPI001FD3105A|nr:PAS-domain containing protein [Phaeobacter sp. J2-8]MCJ7875063.1 PAS-domain containing protein [Phaeobacter sp. J2-8]
MLSELSLLQIIVLVGAALLGATMALGFAILPGRKRTTAEETGIQRDDAVSYLFRDTDLIDATDPAAVLTTLADDFEENAWQQLCRIFEPRFGTLPLTPDAAFSTRAERSRSYGALKPDDRGQLIFVRADDRVRVSLVDDAPAEIDRQIAFDVSRELRFLRSAIADAPNAIWSVNPEGRVAWHNRAYGHLAARINPNDSSDNPIFAIESKDVGKAPLRLPLQVGDKDSRNWFEISTRATADGFVAYATSVDAVVQAEQAQRKFVQTLTKTFAHLSTGLAIFDRNQRLALFNPALIDLTAMPAEFLTSKPSLAAFFDYLREHQIMPEPKNYSNWREKMSALIAAARDGRYSKTWNLPSGLTYRVTGKPHPDGAVAFLFEDISAEISLTRRFRAELETSQAVLDRQNRALAVFSQMGILTFSNQAFRTMWRFDPDSSFAETTITDVLRIWQSECAPSPAWGGLPKFIASFGERAPRRADLIHERVGQMEFLAEPLPGGATLISFSAQDAALVLDRTTAKQQHDDGSA